MKINRPIDQNFPKELEKSKLLLQTLFDLLIENGGQNLTPGIRNIILILNDEQYSIDIRMDNAGTVFRDMMGGMGTLGDFVICHADPDIDEKLNKQLNDIEEELWDFFGLNLSHLPSVEEGYPPGHPYWSIKDPEGENK